MIEYTVSEALYSIVGVTSYLCFLIYLFKKYYYKPKKKEDKTQRTNSNDSDVEHSSNNEETTDYEYWDVGNGFSLVDSAKSISKLADRYEACDSVITQLEMSGKADGITPLNLTFTSVAGEDVTYTLYENDYMALLNSLYSERDSIECSLSDKIRK